MEIRGGGISRREALMSSLGLMSGAFWIASHDGLAHAAEFANSNFSLRFAFYIYLPAIPMRRPNLVLTRCQGKNLIHLKDLTVRFLD